MPNHQPRSLNLSSAEAAKQRITDLVTGFSVETTPGSAARIADYRAHLRPATTVYVTFLAGSRFESSIAVAKRLRGEGFDPIPHFAARSIPNRRFLEESLRQLRDEVDLRKALLIGGAVDRPVGDFADSMQLLETGLFDKYGIERIGIAGHPEGNPDIPDQAIKQALAWKNDFAARSGAKFYVVTQFCFEATPIIEWDRRIRAEGIDLPLVIGVPGLATVKTLLGHARACGIGPSMRFLAKQARNLARLMTLSAPDKLLAERALHRAEEPECGIAGVHIYPLGGLRKSAKWAYAVTDGGFTMKAEGKGFLVEVDLS
jgi:methylenetetrahydrofolate reductase (NADPH)